MGRILTYKDGMKPPLHSNLWQNIGNARNQQRKHALHGMNQIRAQEEEKRELKDQITSHVKPSDCCEKKILHWDDEGEMVMEKMGIEGR